MSCFNTYKPCNTILDLGCFPHCGSIEIDLPIESDNYEFKYYVGATCYTKEFTDIITLDADILPIDQDIVGEIWLNNELVSFNAVNNSDPCKEEESENCYSKVKFKTKVNYAV